MTNSENKKVSLGDYVVKSMKDDYKIVSSKGRWSLRVGRDTNVGLLCREGLENPEGEGFGRILNLLHNVTEILPVSSPQCCSTVSDCIVQSVYSHSIDNDVPVIVHPSKGELVACALTALQALNVWLDEDEMKSVVSVLESNFDRCADVYNPPFDEDADAVRLAQESVVHQELDKLKS